MIPEPFFTYLREQLRPAIQEIPTHPLLIACGNTSGFYLKKWGSQNIYCGMHAGLMWRQITGYSHLRWEAITQNN